MEPSRMIALCNLHELIHEDVNATLSMMSVTLPSRGKDYRVVSRGWRIVAPAHILGIQQNVVSYFFYALGMQACAMLFEEMQRVSLKCLELDLEYDPPTPPCSPGCGCFECAMYSD